MPSKHIGEVRTDENAFILIQCFWGCGVLSRQFVLIDLDCLIILLEIKPTGITLTTDCSCSGRGLSYDSEQEFCESSSTLRRVSTPYLLPPYNSRHYFGSCVFFRVSIKRVCEKKTQVVVGLSTSSRRIYVLWRYVFFEYPEILGSSFVKKQVQVNRFQVELTSFLRKCNLNTFEFFLRL